MKGMVGQVNAQAKNPAAKRIFSTSHARFSIQTIHD